ncbi:unnamed protein product [Mesocestoides corti]|uniref:Leucine-rich repeat-containing protein 34 n=1 Tax=Mesocestoides corti TaxID=53468 RepID=A0A0R3UNP3_MESCO|nr:unnamed protein product [Mesocestoides corti]
MIDKRLICLQQLIESYQNSQYDPTEDGPSLEEIKWIYLKVCGNNFRETCYRLRDREIPSLCASLLNVPVINSLDLRYNELTNEGAITLGNFLKNDRCLKELNLMGNNITADGAKELGIALKLNHTLKILKMTGNPIKREGGIHLAHGLQANNTLTHLDVGECDMDIASAIAFATVLRTNNSLLCFNINRLLLFTHQEEQTVHMWEMLCLNTTLTELHLAKCDMRDFGAKRLVDALERNKTIQVLDVSANRISSDGAIAFARALRNRCSLTVLDLSFNRIQNEGAIALAEVLKKHNDRLIVLALASNEIHEKGLCALADALLDNDHLRYIYLWGNDISDKAAAAWGHLQTIGRLREDSTDLRPYKVDGVVKMAMLNNDCDYRRYRFAVPWWGPQAPEDRSVALF